MFLVFTLKRIVSSYFCFFYCVKLVLTTSYIDSQLELVLFCSWNCCAPPTGAYGMSTGPVRKCMELFNYNRWVRSATWLMTFHIHIMPIVFFWVVMCVARGVAHLIRYFSTFRVVQYVKLQCLWEIQSNIWLKWFFSFVFL